jgi:hypothetical protein
MNTKVSKAENNFVTLLKEVSEYCSTKAIAIQCLVTSEKVEAWLKGELPPRSIMPVLNTALRHLQKYHGQSSKTES